MSIDDDHDQWSEEDGEFVAAVFARSAEDAERYRELLEDHDIPTVVGDEEPDEQALAPGAKRRGVSRGVPVLVPEALLDEASEVIADREDLDEFALDEEDDEDEDEEDFGFGPEAEDATVDFEDDDEDDLEEDEDDEEEPEDDDELEDEDELF